MFVCSSSGPSLYFGDASKVGSRPTVRTASPVVRHVETNIGVSPKLDALGVHIKRRKDKLEELAFSVCTIFFPGCVVFVAAYSAEKQELMPRLKRPREGGGGEADNSQQGSM